MSFAFDELVAEPVLAWGLALVALLLATELVDTIGFIIFVTNMKKKEFFNFIFLKIIIFQFN